MVLLPDDCFNILKQFLLFKRDDRLAPSHVMAMNELREYINDRVTSTTIDSEIWKAYGGTRTCFLNKRMPDGLTGSGYALDKWTSDAWWDLNRMNSAMAERLFVHMMKSLFNKVTRRRMIISYLNDAKGPVNICHHWEETYAKLEKFQEILYNARYTKFIYQDVGILDYYNLRSVEDVCAQTDDFLFNTVGMANFNITGIRELCGTV